MSDKPKNMIWLRVLSGILLIALLSVGGWMLFNAGVTRGAMTGVEGELMRPDFAPYHYPMRGHFFPGSFFFGLLFLFLVMGLFRRAFFGYRWKRHGMHWMHGYGGMDWKDRAEKWHAEMHERMEAQPGDTEEPEQTEEQ